MNKCDENEYQPNYKTGKKKMIMPDYCNSPKNCNEVQLQLLGSKYILVTLSSSPPKYNRLLL